MKYLYVFLYLIILHSCATPKIKDRPNVILLMCDDLGWGDVGFNGNQIIRTPHLDELASKGMVFNRFYTASPVCSPTRASCLTGRNPYRMNIVTANSGHMKTAEVTLAEILRKNGYHTGFFGKWHLGTFTTKMKDSNRGRPGNYADFSIPSQHGFETFFSTEAKVPTYNPMLKPIMYNEKIGESPRYGWQALKDRDSSDFYGTHYWHGKEAKVDDNLSGDDAAIIMDRALHFIEQNSDSEDPFFVVIWLHTPHLPVVADEQQRSLYVSYDLKEQLYYGTITAMDQQVGRLWSALEKLGKAKNTMLWFCSDNGPENGTPGQTGSFRERKRSLYEGGIRVPSFVVWEDGIEPNQTLDFPMVTSDYMPTILDFLSIRHQLNRPMDGISMKSAMQGKETQRAQPIGFLFRNKMSWMTHQYKLISVDKGQTFELYDLLNDPKEQINIIGENSDLVVSLKEDLFAWIKSVDNSRSGEDY